jgi:hypothetical protein
VLTRTSVGAQERETIDLQGITYPVDIANPQPIACSYTQTAHDWSDSPAKRRVMLRSHSHFTLPRAASSDRAPQSSAPPQNHLNRHGDRLRIGAGPFEDTFDSGLEGTACDAFTVTADEQRGFDHWPCATASSSASTAVRGRALGAVS